MVAPTNGKSDHYQVTTEALSEQIEDVSKTLKTLTARFDAHAEQEADRAQKSEARLSSLESKLQNGAIPTALLANLFTQTSEGQGPTGPAAVAATSAVAVVAFLLPRITAWLESRAKK